MIDQFNTQLDTPKFLLASVMLVASVTANAGLFGLGSSTMSWKEEVLLHDGQVIVAERFYNLGGYPTLESTERAALDETVTFNLPSTGQKITWKTDFRDTEPELKRIALSEFPVELTKANVIVGRPATKLLKPFYSVAGVNKENYYVVPQYRTILQVRLNPEPCPQYPSGPKAPLPIPSETSRQ